MIPEDKKNMTTQWCSAGRLFTAATQAQALAQALPSPGTERSHFPLPAPIQTLTLYYSPLCIEFTYTSMFPLQIFKITFTSAYLLKNLKTIIHTAIRTHIESNTAYCRILGQFGLPEIVGWSTCQRATHWSYTGVEVAVECQWSCQCLSQMDIRGWLGCRCNWHSSVLKYILNFINCMTFIT